MARSLCCAPPGAAAGIRKSEQFDQVIAGRWRGRLHQEDLFTTHTLQYLHGDFSIRKPFQNAVADPSHASFPLGRVVRIGIGKSVAEPIPTTLIVVNIGTTDSAGRDPGPNREENCRGSSRTNLPICLQPMLANTSQDAKTPFTATRKS
jgi:hypothetical protein